MTAELSAEVVVIGGGGCGLVAAIAAARAGAQTIVVEKARKPLSNTARSGGMIPAAGTRFQRAAGIEESPAELADDIFRKNGRSSDAEATLLLARTAPRLVEWLVDEVGVALTFVGDFKYPGHSQFRMHAPPSRTGAELVADLRKAVEAHERAELVLGAAGAALLRDADGAVVGVEVDRAGERVRIAARKVILASNGFGGNADMVRRHCPEIAGALYFGGEGSTGEAIRWGVDAGGEAAFMDAYQGHSTVAVPHGILITYAATMEGGVLVNRAGRRFGDETRGYSEFALEVLRQPEQLAFNVYDARVHQLCQSFEDYRDAVEVGAIRRGETLAELADALQIDADGLAATVDAYQAAARGEAPDPFGRARCLPLAPPYFGVKVTGALFHTQGGLRVDEHARVRRAGGGVVPNLYAGGGVAAGISGHGPGGYLSGNGLLTALGYGMLAGRHAARAIREESP